MDAGHKDNWYLSAHRAISVCEAMQKDGVSPARLAVMGYADQHPIADNNTTAGKAQNRRVEVLILPTRAQASSFASRSTTPKTSRTRKPVTPDFNKDGVGSNPNARTDLNK